MIVATSADFVLYPLTAQAHGRVDYSAFSDHSMLTQLTK